MGVEGIVGLIIGTRPDTLPDKVVDMLARLNEEMPVIVELGAESSHDSTLALINRGIAGMMWRMLYCDSAGRGSPWGCTSSPVCREKTKK